MYCSSSITRCYGLPAAPRQVPPQHLWGLPGWGLPKHWDCSALHWGLPFLSLPSSTGQQGGTRASPCNVGAKRIMEQEHHPPQKHRSLRGSWPLRARMKGKLSRWQWDWPSQGPEDTQHQFHRASSTQFILDIFNMVKEESKTNSPLR